MTNSALSWKLLLSRLLTSFGGLALTMSDQTKGETDEQSILG